METHLLTDAVMHSTTLRHVCCGSSAAREPLPSLPKGVSATTKKLLSLYYCQKEYALRWMGGWSKKIPEAAQGDV